MKADRPSFTAAWVAACRGLAASLPEGARLADDPFGLRFGGPAAEAVARAAARFPRLGARLLASDLVLSMQLRTRVLDDELRRFVAAGGRQVLLLGAGFDCRAARFHRELGGVTVFEVDHPATQERKRRVLAEAGAESARVAYLAWDFEREPMTELPGRLGALGHDAARPTLTLWEGVTMYLFPEAIDATVAAVRALSAPRSPFVITYFDRLALERPTPRQRLTRAVVSRVGEPFRFGWIPAELPGFLAARGFALISDRSNDELARALFSPRFAARYRGARRRIAVAEPA
jgi:methyltransferase (TIGR00027 family)